MNRIGKFLLFLLIALMARPLFAAANVQIPVTYYKLPNGLKVVISEDHIAPVVAVAVYYHTGFRIEPKNQTGFVHLFEHMMFQGTPAVPKFEISKYVQSNGGVLNGSTRFDYTNYYEELPADRVETALWLEGDRMKNLKVTEENLANQKDVVMEEVRVNVTNQPYALYQWIDLWENANKNWYNSHNGYGDFTDLKAATVKMAQDFYDTYYAPNNAVLAVVGDVDTAAIKNMVQKYFAAIPSRPQPATPDVSEPQQTQEKRLQQKDTLAKLPSLAIGYHLPSQDSPDYPAMVLLNLILEGDQSSRLFQRLVKEKQLCLDWSGSIYWGLGNEFDYSGPMLLTMTGIYKQGVSANDLISNIDAVIGDVSKNGVTEKEVNDALVRFRSGYYDQLENHVSRAHLLATFALFSDRPEKVNTALDPFLKVKPADVQAAAAKYLIPSNRTIIDRVPAEGGK